MAPMRATLLLILLFAALATAHAGSVSCENKCQKPITMNGVSIAVAAKLDIQVDGVLALEVVDATGVKLYGTSTCPADVTALVVVYEEGYVKVEVGAVKLIVGLVETVVGLVLGVIQCVL